VTAYGGWRDRNARWLRRATFRFRAVTGGVRLSFPVRRGDRISYSVFGDRLHATTGGIADERARTTLRPGVVRFRFAGGYVSSESSRLTRATMTTDVARTARLGVTIRAHAACGR
jgi:hypothetical protein